MVPARNTWVSPNISMAWRWARAWYSPEKFRSISGTLPPPKPRKVSKGMSKPSFTYLRAAHRADLVRHVRAAAVGAVR